jgi:hypothetical protein
MTKCKDNIGRQRWFCFLSEDYLLDDEQGLSMGEMLTVNFRQPSYEFTFNVGLDLLF